MSKKNEVRTTIQYNKHYIIITLEDIVVTGGNKKYSTLVFLNPETLFIEKMIKRNWMLMRHNKTIVNKKFTKYTWDDNDNLVELNGVYMSSSGVVKENSKFEFLESGELVRYEDNLGNYWGKKEFTIDNPYEIKHTMFRGIVMHNYFLSYLRQPGEMEYKIREVIRKRVTKLRSYMKINNQLNVGQYE